MTVGFGVIGSGYMGRTYAAGLSLGQVPGGRLVAVAGGRRADGVAREFGVTAAATIGEVLERSDVDAVIIATPHTTHLPIARAAAAAGKHVYTEKPMAVSVEDCDAMIAACRAAGVQLTVNKVLRFREAPRAAKRLIDEGEIGDVRFIQSRGSWTSFFLQDVVDDSGRVIVPAKPWAMDPAEGSQFLDWGVHACDVLRWFTGSEAVLAFARYRTFGTAPPADLSAMVEYEFSSGVLAQVLMTYELPEPGIEPADAVFVSGSRGMIDCDQYGRVRLGRGGGWELIAEQPAFDFLRDYLDPNRLLAFSAQVQDFAEAVETGRAPAVTGADGRAAVGMGAAADRSAATGEAVRLATATMTATQ